MRIPVAQPSWLQVVAVWIAVILLGAVSAFSQTNEQRSLILVVGAPGEEEWGRKFAASAELWQVASEKGGFQITVIGESTNSPLSDRTQLFNALTNATTQTNGELWLVLVGHGTFDGKIAKFNLRGPDVSSEELAAALKPIQRPLAVINCASASGPFLNALSATGRVVITATRSGYELNVTRFGDFFAQGVASPAADLDKDGQTSLLETYLMASKQVEQFYKEAGRLATEHALLDDNGDKLGTPADWFTGVRATKKPENGKSVDGVRAHQMNLVRGAEELELNPQQRARRDELEREITVLRERKKTMAEEEYYGELERILLEIARLYGGT